MIDGSGISLSNIFAVSNHSLMIISAFFTASCGVLPSAKHSGRSGTVTKYRPSHSDQKTTILYFVISSHLFVSFAKT